MLELELVARLVRCEVPHCVEQAVEYFGNEMPVFICEKHAHARDSGLAVKLKAVITAHQRELVFAAANRAWAHTEDEVMFTYDPGAAVQRFIDAPTVAPRPEEKVALPVVRPSIKTLSAANADLPLMEFFPLI